MPRKLNIFVALDFLLSPFLRLEHVLLCRFYSGANLNRGWYPHVCQANRRGDSLPNRFPLCRGRLALSQRRFPRKGDTAVPGVAPPMSAAAPEGVSSTPLCFKHSDESPISVTHVTSVSTCIPQNELAPSFLHHNGAERGKNKESYRIG